MNSSFGISTEYMPKDATGIDIVDPFSHTIQWSRRFIGLKLYLSILMYGWKGMEQLVDQQIELGKYLKSQIQNSGWQVYNDTTLPVVCFGREHLNEKDIRDLCQKIISTGQTWISVYKVKDKFALRSCITNYNTTRHHIDCIIDLINETYNSK